MKNDDITQKHRDIRSVDLPLGPRRERLEARTARDPLSSPPARDEVGEAENQVQSANLQLSDALDQLRDNIDQKFHGIQDWLDRARRPLAIIQRRPATFFTFFVVGGVVLSLMRNRGVQRVE